MSENTYLQTLIESAFDWLLLQVEDALGGEALPSEVLTELSPLLSDLAVTVVLHGGEMSEEAKAPFVARAHSVLRQFGLVEQI